MTLDLTMTNKNNQENRYCLLLAGGKGSRLWPVSNEEMPKQFLDFFSVGRTQLQQTFDRAAALVPVNNVFVCTTKRYECLVREQLPEIPSENILAEPLPRGTAPSVAWAAHRIGCMSQDALLMVMPTDQMIQREDMFVSDLERALDFVANHDQILTIGVHPTRPETDYGYIQMGETQTSDAEEDGSGVGVCKVQSFTEKPERDFAELFMQSGEFLWNTGLVLSSVRYLRQVFTEIFPPVLRLLNERNTTPTLQEELDYVAENYCKYPNMQFDKAMLENREDVCVMPCHFGWADLGTWHSIHEMKRRSQTDNVVLRGNVTLKECERCIVTLPDGHSAVIYGLEDYVVAENNNVLLICPKNKSTMIARETLY